jgi:hypothetical protein
MSASMASALRRIGSVLFDIAGQLERRSTRTESRLPAPDIRLHDERVYELRNRILNGYY